MVSSSTCVGSAQFESSPGMLLSRVRDEQHGDSDHSHAALLGLLCQGAGVTARSGAHVRCSPGRSRSYSGLVSASTPKSAECHAASALRGGSVATTEHTGPGQLATAV